MRGEAWRHGSRRGRGDLRLRPQGVRHRAAGAGKPGAAARGPGRAARGGLRELRRDSDNSSVPPSADPRSGKRRRKGKRSDRKPGGQPGHPGSGRGLLPIERVDEVIEHLPECCRRCGHSLAERSARGPVRRHQVAELPETAVRVSEHRLAPSCPGCGAITQAELPPDVPRERFGVRLQAAVPPLLLGFGSRAARWPASLGAVRGGDRDRHRRWILPRSGVALREPEKRLCDAVCGAPVVCVDETGWSRWARRDSSGAPSRVRRR